MTTVSELIKMDEGEPLSRTDKQKKILHIAREHMNASPVNVGKQLEEELGDEAPSQAYVYNVLKRAGPDDVSDLSEKVVKRFEIVQEENGELEIIPEQ